MTRARICAVVLLGALLLVGVAGAVRLRNGIAVTVSAPVVKNKTYEVVVRGFSRHRAVAYVYVDYQGCARSYVAERDRVNYHTPYVYSVRGAFTKNTFWQSHASQADHACGYLISYSSGTLLARSHVSFDVH